MGKCLVDLYHNFVVNLFINPHTNTRTCVIDALLYYKWRVDTQMRIICGKFVDVENTYFDE